MGINVELDFVPVHGEKEYEEAERRAREGIPLNPKVAADLRAVGEELGVEYDLESRYCGSWRRRESAMRTSRSCVASACTGLLPTRRRWPSWGRR
jgi:hypothetical protein